MLNITTDNFEESLKGKNIIILFSYTKDNHDWIYNEKGVKLLNETFESLRSFEEKKWNEIEIGFVDVDKNMELAFDKFRLFPYSPNLLYFNNWNWGNLYSWFLNTEKINKFYLESLSINKNN